MLRWMRAAKGGFGLDHVAVADLLDVRNAARNNTNMLASC
jgi:hypothetical protein